MEKFKKNLLMLSTGAAATKYINETAKTMNS